MSAEIDTSAGNGGKTYLLTRSMSGFQGQANWGRRYGPGDELLTAIGFVVGEFCSFGGERCESTAKTMTPVAGLSIFQHDGGAVAQQRKLH